MLNFRNTLIAVAVILFALLVFNYLMPVSGWIYAGIIIAALIIMAWGSKNIRSGFYVTAICHGDKQKRAVALTFDDGPDAQVTPMILDVLKETHVEAAFFVIGSKAEKHAEILERMDNEGHIIGCHTYSHHFFFDLFSSSRMRHEMKQTDNIVYARTGKKPGFFRPPYGVTNPPLAQAVKSMEYQTVGWSLKSNDTVIEDESLLLDNLISNVKQGDIILFHDNKPWTMKILVKFIQYLKENGYEINRLDKLINQRAYAN